MRLHLADLWNLRVSAVAVRIAGGTNSLTCASGEDAYGLHANIQVANDLRLGGYYVTSQIANNDWPIV